MKANHLTSTVTAAIQAALDKNHLALADKVRAEMAAAEAAANGATNDSDRAFHQGVRAGIVDTWILVLNGLDL